MANKYKKNTFPKKCACGKRYSEDEWEKLDFVGLQRDINRISVGKLRNCVCGSTLIAMFKEV